MLRSLFFILQIIVCSVLHAQTHGYFIHGRANSAKIPFEIHNNLVVLKVEINGSGPYNFILDSGSKNSFILQPSIVDSLGLASDGQLNVFGAGSNDTVKAEIYRNISLKTGRLEGIYQSILVLRENPIPVFELIGIDIHGILGTDIFNKYVVGINYESRLITLKTPQVFKEPNKYEVIPLEIYNSKGYFNTKITNDANQQKTIKLMLDSGASLSLMFNQNNETDTNFKFFENYVEAEIGTGLGGNIPGKTGVLKQIKFSNFTFSAIPSSTVNITINNNEFLFNERNGLIGAELLSRFNLWYHFLDNKLYLQPNKRFHRSFVVDLTGLTWDAQRISNGIMVISTVIKNSPAWNAGIRKGDIILNINGKNISHYDNLSINQLFSDPKVKLLTFEIMRGFNTISISFQPKTYF